MIRVRHTFFNLWWLFLFFLSHLSLRLTRRTYRIGLELASVCPLTISNMNISKTRGPIATKFYLKHHRGGGKPALGFGPGRIRTLVSMATDSSHRVIMGKTAAPRFLGCFDRILFILAGNDDIHKSLDEFEIRPDPTTDYGVSCPWASEKNPHVLIMVKTVSPRFLGCFWSDPFHTCR